MEQNRPLAGRTRRREHWMIGLLLVVALAGAGSAGTLFIKYRQLAHTTPAQQRQQLLAVIGRTVALPSATPEVSTILNTTKITNPTLAGEAKNGDELFIYVGARRLILYRPAWHKVIDMLRIQNPAPSALPPTATSTKHY